MGKICKIILLCMPAILAGMFLLSCHSKNELSPEEAIRSLKVFNSDLTNLSSGIQENAAFTELGFLLSEPTSPLCSKNGLFGNWLNDTLTSMSSFSGSYTWTARRFLKTGESDNIDIRFPYQDSLKNDCHFRMNGFNCRQIAPGLCFPSEIQAIMTLEEENILTIEQSCTFEDGLPAHMDISLKGEEFEALIKAVRTRIDNKGALDISLEFRARGHDIIKGKVHAILGYNGSQMFYRTYEPDVTVFDVEISGILNYGKVDPTSKDYVKSFNDNCHIGFYDAGNGKKIGDFGISPLKDGERLGWVVYLSDGSPVFLEEYLLVVEKIFNYKLPNKTPIN
jgi:hypothetical protein